MKLMRYITLAFLAALLGLGSSIGSSGTSALAQGQTECTVTIQPGESIQAAIDKAQEGAVICLEEGTWEENVKIEKSLTLQGAGQEQTVIDGIKDKYPVVWIMAPETAQTVSIEIDGLKITGANGQGCADRGKRICAAGVMIRGKVQVKITNSSISYNGADPYGYGIELLGSAKATVTGSAILGNPHGVDLWDSAQIVLTDSVVTGGRWGIALWNSTQAEIRGSTISDFHWMGVQVSNGAQAKVVHSIISKTGTDGIAVEGSARAEVKDNIIENNYGCGISAWCAGQVRGEKNKMVDNGADLCGNLEGTLRIPLAKPIEEEIIYPDGRYRSLQEAVDALRPGGRLILLPGEHSAGVTIAKEMTLEAAEGAEVTLKGRNERNAPVLSLIGGVKLQLKGLKITGGGTGMDLGADAQAEITGSTITENWWGGIAAGGRAEVAIRNSAILWNGDGEGLSLWGSARATISDSTISLNGFIGISLGGSAQAEITSSTVTRNGQGIRLEDSSQVTIGRSVISENGYSILLEASARAGITDSVISDNGQDGILLEDSAEAKIEGNTIINNGGYGVALYLKSCGFEYGEKIFSGHVSGRANTIPGPDELDGNQKGGICPDSLSFLEKPCGSGDLP